MIVDKCAIKLDCTKGAYAYACLTRSGVVLIDTGNPKKGEAILAELSGHGINKENVRAILLTHGDIDHIGNVNYLAKACGIKAYINKKDYPLAIGTEKKGGIKDVYDWLIRERVYPENLEVFENEELYSVKNSEKIGHSVGHTVFTYENILFSGDLFGTKNGNIIPSPKIFTWNVQLNNESCKSLDITGIDWICPAHGEPVRSAALAEYLKII